MNIRWSIPAKARAASMRTDRQGILQQRECRLDHAGRGARAQRPRHSHAHDWIWISDGGFDGGL